MYENFLLQFTDIARQGSIINKTAFKTLTEMETRKICRIINSAQLHKLQKYFFTEMKHLQLK